ncbi:hypothetical protein Syun_008658 [Stephania yunnanensis]|uniref:Uncharacterized protein n=1 Tax=Stephania yunnanensis TaxID=152371 RepID=A0AAP0KF06_9MAGN
MAEGQGHGFLPNMWSTFELNTDSEDKKLDPGFLNVTKKPGLQVKLSMSIPQSSGLNLQIEPPSNQSYTSNFTAPLWHEEYKMIGMKRQWPFSLDNPPGPLLNSNFPPFFPLTAAMAAVELIILNQKFQCSEKDLQAHLHLIILIGGQFTGDEREERKWNSRYYSHSREKVSAELSLRDDIRREHDRPEME